MRKVFNEGKRYTLIHPFIISDTGGKVKICYLTHFYIFLDIKTAMVQQPWEKKYDKAITVFYKKTKLISQSYFQFELSSLTTYLANNTLKV